MKIRIEDLLTGGSESFELNCHGKIIGRSETRVDISLPIITNAPYLNIQDNITYAIRDLHLRYVSFAHCTIREDNGQLYFKDHSTNGTRLPGRNQVLNRSEEAPIESGEPLLLGKIYPIMITYLDDLAAKDLTESANEARKKEC